METKSLYLGATFTHSHGSIGSVLAQMSLILGLVPLCGEMFKVKRKEVAVIVACEVLALILAVSIVKTGRVEGMNTPFGGQLTNLHADNYKSHGKEFTEKELCST